MVMVKIIDFLSVPYCAKVVLRMQVGRKDNRKCEVKEELYSVKTFVWYSQ